MASYSLPTPLIERILWDVALISANLILHERGSEHTTDTYQDARGSFSVGRGAMPVREAVKRLRTWKDCNPAVRIAVDHVNVEGLINVFGSWGCTGWSALAGLLGRVARSWTIALARSAVQNRACVDTLSLQAGFPEGIWHALGRPARSIPIAILMLPAYACPRHGHPMTSTFARMACHIESPKPEVRNKSSAAKQK